MEHGGVNGHSTLPRDPAWYRAAAAALPPLPPHSRVRSSFRRRALEGLAYNVADVLTRWHYPHWNNHRPWHPIVEGRSEEHTSELQSLMRISYAVFCLKKK